MPRPRTVRPDPVRHVPDAERRARLGRRHLLAPGSAVDDPVTVASALAGLHATEYASAVLSAWARSGAQPADVERALWTERTLVPQMAMRQTLFMFPRELLPAVRGSTCRRVGATLERTLVRLVEKEGVADDGAAWLERACAGVLETLADGVPRSTRRVREETPDADARFSQGAGTRWASEVQLAPRVLWLLHLRGEVVRGGNEGDWRSARPLWTTSDAWLGPVGAVDEASGWATLVARYLRANGPATVDDITWWLGATKSIVGGALASVGAVPVSLDSDAVGWLLPDDVDPVTEPGPWAALLPLLDPALMGWKDRGFVEGHHRGQLYDSVGNAGTTAWLDGRVVGAWVQDDTQRVRLRLLEDVDAGRRAELESVADRLTEVLDGQRVFSVYPSAAMRG